MGCNLPEKVAALVGEDPRDTADFSGPQKNPGSSLPEKLPFGRVVYIVSPNDRMRDFFLTSMDRRFIVEVAGLLIEKELKAFSQVLPGCPGQIRQVLQKN